MRKTAIFVLSILFMLCVLVPSPSNALCIDAGQEIPDISLPTIDGKNVSLKDHKGKIVLLAFWASWCPRCREELVFLEELKNENSDVVVLAVNQETQNLSDRHVEELKEKLSEWGIDFPVLLDRNLEAWGKLCINALPTSVILDQSGSVRYAEANYYWESKEKILKILGEIRNGKSQ